MGLFDDMLGNDESLFLDTVALDYDYQPKLIPHRESEQKYLAECIKPLFSGRSGRNLLIHGKPGVGKTVALKHVLNEIEEHTDEIVPIYVNCWQKNTTYKVILEICDQIGFKFTQNKKTDDLFNIVKERLNKKSAVFVFDEVDKLDDFDFLYTIIEQIYRKSVILITNYKEWLGRLDERVRSRLNPELMSFKVYTSNQIKDILDYRLKFAFVHGVWEDSALIEVVNRTVSLGDIRSGLYLMKEAGLLAEEKSSKKISVDFVTSAIEKLDGFSTKKVDDLDDELNFILNIVRDNSGGKIGEMFKIYTDTGGRDSYRTFQRRINTLFESSFVDLQKVTGGTSGNTTLVKISGETAKKLTEF